MERMNYINRPKSAYTQEERIEYLEKSLRELRTEKDEIRREKGEYRHKILRLEEENRKLKEKLGEKIDTIQVLIRERYEEKGEKLELFKENKKLKKKIERWEKCFKKGGFNPQDVEYLMDEDTLQEIKDIGEI